MIRARWALVVLAAAVLCGSARAAEGPRVIASGDWSKPVADARGYAVRGRLVLCEKKIAEDRRETAVYVELQDASPFIGSGMRLFCNFRPTQPDTKGGMQAELRDANRKPVPSQPFAFGGAVPVPQWVSLPNDATIRLRTSPFGVHRPKALAIAPQLTNLWVIADDDPKEYFLSATVVIDSPVEPEVGASEHIWSGAIELPAMRIRNGRSLANLDGRRVARRTNGRGRTRQASLPGSPSGPKRLPGVDRRPERAMGEPWGSRERVRRTLGFLACERGISIPRG